MKTILDITLTAAVLVGGLGAIFGIAVGIMLIVKIWGTNRDAYREAAQIQGGLRNAVHGKIKTMPSKDGDFRVVRGLRWNAKAKKYEANGALSSEAFRSAFPR